MATSRDENNVKVEDNHNISIVDSQQLGIWNTCNYKYPRCSFCSGFYGSCFGEPVCSTCHAFLFPDDINAPEGIPFEEKTDDDDSGNDEPTDFFFENNRSQNRPHYAAIKPDRLTERIKALTILKENDTLAEGLVELLPAEVLLIVFSHLDDISLWSCGQVCRRWQQLIYTETSQEQWKKFCDRRWPLYIQHYKGHSNVVWTALYTKLIRSTPCLLCLHQMTMQINLPIEENSWRRTRLINDLKALRSDPPEGIEAIPLDRQCCHWQASISGPVGSPYEGGRFFLYLQIPHSYPMRPPIVRFITKIFHPNISRHGDIGIDSIQHNWSLVLTISKVLISIQSLLTDPYCHVCMEPKVGKLYADNRLTFNSIAKTWTRHYAFQDVLNSNILLKADFCKSLESG